jgi:hypothetical protein
MCLVSSCLFLGWFIQPQWVYLGQTPNEIDRYNLNRKRAAKYRLVAVRRREVYRRASAHGPAAAAAAAATTAAAATDGRTFLRNPPPPSLHPQRYYELFCCGKLSRKPVDRVVPTCRPAATRHGRRSGAWLVRIHGDYPMPFTFFLFSQHICTRHMS